jgi:hypothetical protein
MKRTTRAYVVLMFTVFSLPLIGFTGLQRFSDEFYAAQKYFYNEAKKKFPKLIKEKAYPEVPILGAIAKEELSKIAALPDFLSARRCFIEEVRKYPEQLYPEIFSFLYNHPALQVSASNKLKFEALESYFTGFHFLFNNEPYYYFHPQVKSNPCPLVFCLIDDKKNQLSSNISNTSKLELNMMLNQGVMGDGLLFKGKNPVLLKPGGNQVLKCNVNLSKLKSDSTYRVMQMVLADPTQPSIKLILPIILLPSKTYLKLPGQFYDLKYVYSSHLKNIDLYTDRTSGPERCSGKNCSGEVRVTLRSRRRKFEQYAFGDAASVQFNLRSSSYPQFSSKFSLLEFELNELGEMQGKARDCPGPVPQSIGPCPAETANNGKQLYGSRKLEVMAYVPQGKIGALFLQLDFEDLKSATTPDVKLSWLETKKLMLQVSDTSGKILSKEIIKTTNLKTELKNLAPGKYICSVFPVTSDNAKQNPGFEINHLNQAARGQFYFRLKGKFVLGIQ